MIFIFFVEGGEGEGEVLGVLIGGNEPEWEMEGPGESIDRVHYAPGSH